MKTGKKSIFYRKMFTDRTTVIAAIESGDSLTQIHDLHFSDIPDYETFCRALRTEEPELMKRYKEIKATGKHTKFHKTLEANKDEVIAMIDENYSLEEINNALFFMNSRKGFNDQLKGKYPELMIRYKEAKRLKNHGPIMIA